MGATTTAADPALTVTFPVGVPPVFAVTATDTRSACSRPSVTFAADSDSVVAVGAFVESTKMPPAPNNP